MAPCSSTVFASDSAEVPANRFTRRRALRVLAGGAAAGLLAVASGAVLPSPAEAAMSLAMKLLRAEAWAKSQVGSTAYGTGRNTLCQRFVENAYGTSGRYPSAIAAARALPRFSRGARGQMVFFAANSSNGGFGHSGIYIGNGQMVSVTTSGVRISSVSGWSRGVAPFIGFANPPSSWPGR